MGHLDWMSRNRNQHRATAAGRRLKVCASVKIVGLSDARLSRRIVAKRVGKGKSNSALRGDYTRANPAYPCGVARANASKHCTPDRH